MSFQTLKLQLNSNVSTLNKAKSVVKHVLADPCREEVIKTLTETNFSIIIDESTDISAKKQLALVVRYFCDEANSIRSQFLMLIEVTNSLTATPISFFERNNIPLVNIIGYASDTTNVMFGEHHSVVRLLKDRIPNLFVMKSLCHSAHLCASHSCEKLSRAIEDLVRDIYSHFPIVLTVSWVQTVPAFHIYWTSQKS